MTDLAWGCRLFEVDGYSTNNCCIGCHLDHPVSGGLLTFTFEGSTFKVCCSARSWYRDQDKPLIGLKMGPLYPELESLSIPDRIRPDMPGALWIDLTREPIITPAEAARLLAEDKMDRTVDPTLEVDWRTQLIDKDGRRTKEIMFALFLQERTLHLSAEKLRKAVAAFSTALDRKIVPPAEKADLYMAVGMDASFTYLAAKYYVETLGAFGTEGHNALVLLYDLGSILYMRLPITPEAVIEATMAAVSRSATSLVAPEPVVPAVPRIDPAVGEVLDNTAPKIATQVGDFLVGSSKINTRLPDPLSSLTVALMLEQLLVAVAKIQGGELNIPDVDLVSGKTIDIQRFPSNLGYTVRVVDKA